jgi:long-chain acyl-CoA synthetase
MPTHNSISTSTNTFAHTGKTILEQILRKEHVLVEKIALQDEEQSVSYGQLSSAVDQRVLQLKPVSVLGLAIDNSVEWLLWDLAAQTAGIVCVPLPSFFTSQQVDHAIQSAGVSHLLTANGLTPTKANPCENLHPQTSKITYTSGTTGTPKGVCLSQAAMTQVVSSILSVLGKGFNGTHLCILPLAVLLENVAGVYTGLLAGCTIQLRRLQNFGEQYSELHHHLKKTCATSIIIVPEILRLLMAQVMQNGILPDLQFIAVGGSKIDSALLAQAQQLGLPVYEGYGLSECASVVSLNTPQQQCEARVIGSVGKLLPHLHAVIKHGEICILQSGFLGYIGETAKNEVATGDLGSINSDGFVFITGRKKNTLINSYGRNISPEWVESVLLLQPSIAQAIVVGDGQPHLSALIVPSPTTQVSPYFSKEKIVAAVTEANQQLPDYARIAPEYIHIVQPFTLENNMLTGTGRPKRNIIIQHYYSLFSVNKQEQAAMNFYDRLTNETQKVRQALYQVPQIRDGILGDISRETYIAYLTEAYHHVSHTVRFLMTMGSHLPTHKDRLQQAIADYIKDEVGHEEWILNDIAAAGGCKDQARQSTPNLATQVLIAYNYDYIQRKNPVGFFGMVFMLESVSVDLASQGADALKDKLGLTDKAFSYLYSHGELDIGHMAFFEKTVNTISDPDDQAAIIEVAQNTFQLFADVLRAIPHDSQTNGVLTKEDHHAA